MSDRLTDTTPQDPPESAPRVATPAFPRPFGPHYLLLAPLGQGGMGNVFLTLTGGQGTRRICALKTLPPLSGGATQHERAERVDLQRRFADEAKLCMQLSSDNLVYVFDAGMHGDERYLAMELIRGRTLSQVLARARAADKPMTPDDAITLAVEILSALSYLHRFRGLGLVHRDLSPDNIMVTHTGAVKIIDLGIAKWAGRAALTQAGIQWGRLGYKAPEQHLGQSVDARADLFSLGVMLWEMLTGAPLIPADRPRPLRVDAPAPSQMNPASPASLDPIVARALAQERALRYATADEFLTAMLPHQAAGDRKGRLAAYLQDLFGDAAQREAALERQLLQDAEAMATDLVPVTTEMHLSDEASAAHGPGADRSAKSPVPSDPAPQTSPATRRGSPSPGAAGLVRDPYDLVGQILGGRYQVTRAIGRGAMGTVYEATHRGIGKRVAIKVPNVADGGPELIERLKTEAAAAGQVDHPNVAMVTDSGMAKDGRFYYVMELVEGVDLAGVIHRDAPMPLDRVLDIGIQICRAAEAAHTRSVVHRDLKPSNVLLLRRDDQGDHVKVLDFGLAKWMDTNPSGERSTLTRPEAALGTPRYMAPEQIESGGQVDQRADVYAICVILYEMLTGRTPHDPFRTTGEGSGGMADIEDPVVLCRRKLDEPPTLIANHRSGLPEAMERTLMAGLSIDPGARPRSAAEVRRVLVECLRNLDRQPPEVRPAVSHTQSVGQPRTRILAFGVAAMAGLALLLALVLDRKNAAVGHGPTPNQVQPAPGAVAEPMPVAEPAIVPDPAPAVAVPAQPQPVAAAERPSAPAPSPVVAVPPSQPIEAQPVAAPALAKRPPVVDPASLMGAAEQAYQRGDLLAAARDARKALQAGAGIKGHLVLGKILLAMDRKPEARTHYEKALAIEPGNQAAQRGLQMSSPTP